MKKNIILMFLLCLSILDSCTIITYKYNTQENIKHEKLSDFQYFFNNFKNELKENNGSSDIIKKYINYSILNQQYEEDISNHRKSFILSYLNFIFSISVEYNEICMLSLERNKNIYRNKNNITWGIGVYYDDIILYRTSENKNEYPIGCIFRKNNFKWEIIGFVKINK